MATILRVRNLVLGLLLVSGLPACNYNQTRGGTNTSDGPRSLQLEAQGFREIQTAILGPRCLGCHAPETGSKGGSNLVSYSEVRAQLNRIAYRALETKDMPPGRPLSSEEQAALGAWLDQGAPEIAQPGASNVGKKVEAGPSNFANLKDSLFQEKCLICHGELNPAAGLNLGDYAQATAKATQIFERTIVRADMPIAPFPALTPQERRALLKWFELGMPQ